VVVGFEKFDDAGVYRLAPDSLLIATVDIIPPVCSDPYKYGYIAAANALSDVYAMGGRPLFALNICCFPDAQALPVDVTRLILCGGREALSSAGVALLGGHTIIDHSLKFGVAVVGSSGTKLLTNANARPGDKLVLTKPLGTGLYISAFRRNGIDAEAFAEALVSMMRLNDRASAIATSFGITCCTDITGFGLGGHALQMAQASGVCIEIEADALPRLPLVDALIGARVTTSNTRATREWAEPFTRHNHNEAQLELLFDPQTSGGLLLAVSEPLLSDVVSALRGCGELAVAIVGRVVKRSADGIALSLVTGS
jgi:selenide,water dikinase